MTDQEERKLQGLMKDIRQELKIRNGKSFNWQAFKAKKEKK